MYSQTGLAERTFKAAFIYLAGYLVGVCHCGSDISDLFAVADLEHLDAGVHELLTQAVVGLESDAEYHVVRRDGGLHAVCVLCASIFSPPLEFC